MTFEPLQRARYAWLALSLVVIYAFWHRLTLIAAGSDSDFDAYARFVRRRRLHVEWCDLRVYWVWLLLWHHAA